MFGELLTEIGIPALALTATYVGVTTFFIYSRYSLESCLGLHSYYRDVIDTLYDIFTVHNLKSSDYTRSLRFGFFTSFTAYRGCINNMYNSLMLYYVSQIYISNNDDKSKREVDFVSNNMGVMLDALNNEDNMLEKNVLCSKLYELSNSLSSYDDHDNIVHLYASNNRMISRISKKYKSMYRNTYIPTFKTDDSSSDDSDTSDDTSDDTSSYTTDEASNSEENNIDSKDSSDNKGVDTSANDNVVNTEEREDDSETEDEDSITQRVIGTTPCDSLANSSESDNQETKNVSQNSVQLFSPRKYLHNVSAPEITKSVLDTPQFD
jgi:hypothetical protein